MGIKGAGAKGVAIFSLAPGDAELVVLAALLPFWPASPAERRESAAAGTGFTAGSGEVAGACLEEVAPISSLLAGWDTSSLSLGT